MPTLAAAALLMLVLPGPARPAAVEDSGNGAAILVSVTRLVRVQEKEGGPVRPGKPGERLPEGATVATLGGSFCELEFSRAHIVRLSPNSRLKIAQTGSRESGSRVLLNLVGGRIRAFVNRALGEDVDFGVYGATMLTAVKGTDYDMIRGEDGKESVLVNEGRVNVAPLDGLDPDKLEKVFMAALIGNIGLALREGNMITAIPGSPFPSPIPIPPGMPNPWTGKTQPIPGMPDGTKKPGQPRMPGIPGPGGGGFGFP